MDRVSPMIEKARNQGAFPIWRKWNFGVVLVDLIFP